MLTNRPDGKLTIGQSIDLIDTPSVIVDLDIVESNIRKFMNRLKDLPVSIRPHLKTVKSPAFARMLLEAGASGVCVAKLSEAEVMAEAGVEDILITTEIAGAIKLARLARLLSRHSQIKLVVDSFAGADMLNEVGAQLGGPIEVLIEIDVGQNRAGVEPGTPALELAQHIARLDRLSLIGVQGYEGHLQLLDNQDEKRKLCLESMEKLNQTVQLLRSNDFDIKTVTTGGTGTSEICAAAGVTELQPGSFVFMDVAYRKAIGTTYEQALLVVSTVISKPSRSRVVVDAGMKSLSTDSGNAEVNGIPGTSYRPAGDEHGIIEVQEGDIPLNIGDRVELIPSHIDTTVNLHDLYHCHRNRKLEAMWPISARGKVQ